MNKNYTKVLCVAFVFNTALSFVVPVTAYADNNLSDEENVKHYEEETIDESVTISIESETDKDTVEKVKVYIEDESETKEMTDDKEDETHDSEQKLKQVTNDKESKPDINGTETYQSENTSEITEENYLVSKPENEPEEIIHTKVKMKEEQNHQIASDITISTYIESKGWQTPVENGEIAGTTGKGLKVDSFKIKSTNPQVDVKYRSYSSNAGAWLSWTENNKESNPIDPNDQIEAIQLVLDGTMAKDYDVYYRAHSKSLGWLGWAKNGEPAGTRGHNYHIEAIEVRVVKKDQDILEQNKTAYVERDLPTLQTSAHIQSLGWIDYKNNTKSLGITGQGKRLEALKLSLDTGKLQGGIEYRTHVQGYGWQEWKRDGELSGTEGEKKRIEAVEMRFYGEVSNHYDLVYKAHVESFGWLESVISGMPSGTQDIAKRLEALDVEIVEKGSVKASKGDGFRQTPKMNMSAHVQSFGWLNQDSNKVVGTIGKGKRIEGLKLNLDAGNMQGGIEYRSLVQGRGWQEWTRDGQISGTEGQKKRVEAVEIRLYGEVAKYFDLSYKTHVESFGWLDTVISGMPSGTQHLAKRIEALEVKIVRKGATKVSQNSGFKTVPKVNASAHVQTYGWMDNVENGTMIGSIGKSKRIEGLTLSLDAGNMSGGIEYRSFVEGSGWEEWKRDGQLSGTVGKGKRLEAVEIRLHGDVSQHYDVSYKSHVQSYGWLGTVFSGMASGTQMLSKRMEALQVDIIEKGSVKVSSNDGFKRAPIVFIDSGHGGKDPGASYFGVDEATLNLSTGNRVIKSLREKGFDVRASRETDIHLEMKERSSMANEIKPDILFSIHYNAMGRANSRARGIETFIYHRVASGFGQETNRNNFKTDDPRIAKSLKLADLIHENVIKDTKFYDRGVKGNNFHMLREPIVPAALIELGFVDNKADNNIIKTEAYHQLAADAIVKGIVAYFGDWK